jgi:hypothetical protein
MNFLAHNERSNSSGDEIEGRSVHQEVDYSNKRRASQQIKDLNYKKITNKTMRQFMVGKDKINTGNESSIY